MSAEDLDAAILAAGEVIALALVAAGVAASDDSDGVVSIYGDEGWELRVWPRGSGAELDEGPVVVDLVLDRKLELDPYNGERRLWFDPLHAVDLGALRADVHDDVPVIVAAVRAIVAALPGGAA